MSDSYTGALEAAGAVVHASASFGSYQGDWMAEVTLPDGRHGIISGGYGSCSGCDAFEAEIGSDYHGWETGDAHDAANKPVDGCEKCAEYHAKLVAFGERYFDDIKTPEEAALEMAELSYWSSYSEQDGQADFILARLAPSSEAYAKLSARKQKGDADE